MATSQICLPPVNLAKLINPTEKQREFLKAISEKDFVLYGGEAGGGKSYILRWWLILFLYSCYKTLGLRNVQVAIFCEDYPALEDRQIGKMRVEFPRALGTLRQGRTLDFVLRDEYGGGKLGLRNLDDPSKYASAEFAAIAVDELTKNPLSVFNDLRFRLRWPGVDRPKFAAGTNPGGVGHSWVKKYWVTKEYPPEFRGVDPKTGDAYDITDQFVLVKAKASDLEVLSSNYHKSLLTLPPEFSKKVAHGDWDVYTGQYFTQPIRVIPHAEIMLLIKKWHTRSLSGDWGYEHPHCFHWHAKDEHDNVITHDELWDRRIGEAEVGRRITECEGKYLNLAKLNGFTFSWDAGKLSPRALKGQPKSITELVAAALGPRVPKPHPSDSTPGVRLIRARIMSQVLEAGTWLISDRCQKLIEAIPAMIRDEDHPEEMLKVDWNEAQIGDDPVDSASMGLQWMIGSSIKSRDVLLEERLAEVRKGFAGKTESGPVADRFAKFGGKKFS